MGDWHVNIDGSRTPSARGQSSFGRRQQIGLRQGRVLITSARPSKCRERSRPHLRSEESHHADTAVPYISLSPSKANSVNRHDTKPCLLRRSRSKISRLPFRTDQQVSEMFPLTCQPAHAHCLLAVSKHSFHVQTEPRTKSSERTARARRPCSVSRAANAWHRRIQ